MFCGVVISVSMRESGRGGKMSGKSSNGQIGSDHANRTPHNDFAVLP